MKKITWILLAVLLVSLAAPALAEWSPEKPIIIMNYVKAGGGMDISTRKFAELAAKYTDATIVVDNRPGSNGMIAADYLLEQPADGYSVFASTIAYVDNILIAEEDTQKYIWGFEWIDNIMADPFAIIVAEDNNMTLEEVIADAKVNRQKWLGPSGAKNIVAIQFWNAFGMDADWVTYESGPDSLIAVMGGQGIASVGNPGDVEGRTLKNLAIATETKLPKHPDVLNFAELGYPELDKLSMWRGFAVKKGTPPEMIAWWQDLCQKITEDPEWIEFFNEKSIVVHNLTTEEFTQQVKDDIESHIQIMKDADILDADYSG